MTDGGELDDGGVKAVDGGVKGAVVAVDGRNFGQDGGDVIGLGKVDHGVQVGDGDGWVDMQQGVVGTAEDDDGGVAGDLPLEAGEHLCGGLAVDAEIFAGQRPTLGKGVTKKGNTAAGVVQARGGVPEANRQDKDQGSGSKA